MKGRSVILGLLNKKARTGYELNEIFQSVFTHFFDGSFGMIYPTLRTLEKEKKIEKKVIYQEGKPNKNEFSITPEGEKEFLEYLSSKVAKEIRKSDFLMRLYFGEYLDDNKIILIIKKEIKDKEKMIEQLKNDYEKWGQRLTITQQLSFDIGIEQYKSEIKVLKKYIDE